MPNKILGISAAPPGWKAIFFDEDDESITEWSIPIWGLVEKSINGKTTRVVVPMMAANTDSEYLTDCTEEYNFVGIRGPEDSDIAPYANMARKKMRLLMEIEEEEELQEELEEIELLPESEESKEENPQN